MPNANTMEIEPIRHLVSRYIQPNTESVDPFARNCRLAKWRNDLNPNTLAEHHLPAGDFLRMVQSKVAADLVLFDPPYSCRQMQEVYQSVGLHFGTREGQLPNRWHDERDVIRDMLKVGGIVISFGWNTTGMGMSRGFEAIEFLCVWHGAAHYDTLVTVERKLVHQESLFGAQQAEETCHTAPNTQSAPLETDARL